MCEISHSDFVNTFQMEPRQRGGSADAKEGERGDAPLFLPVIHPCTSNWGTPVLSTLIAVLLPRDTSPDSWVCLAEEPVAEDSLHVCVCV